MPQTDAVSQNPYAPPITDLPGPMNGGDAAHIDAELARRKHLNHEASIRSIGLLYYLSAAGAVVSVVTGISGLVGVEMNPEAFGYVVGYLLFPTILAVGVIILGRGLRRLKRWVRIPTCILQGFGLFAFPVGTLISVSIFYLILSKKGQMVFSEEYRQIMDQTPHIKYRTSIIVWLFLGLIVLGIAAAVLIPQFV
jgi:hypothetical protein